ncbi:glycoside hydrolase family 2 protein [Microlunatus soli]|uniref:Glycosyl hydrolases family 2, TIM barrel domain n=1 Tax=Microlunatus soli TaxID=630515 RepID=A0A1H1SRP9_9ACTN|nr:sugar-binding domain-containing protein [Microlunatus soli]SDS50662.1 Glycosyl hydrolases family 2, TIM barrel domain [Microlunatus soli]
MTTVPKPEYPRPQLQRAQWLNLNGPWQFEIDSGDSGIDRGLLDRDLNSEIIVPFAPETELSGIGNTDYLEAVWYRRTVSIPQDWDGQRVLLHFGAVDHDATIWVNGNEVGRHRGGFSSFTVEITAQVTAGSDAVVVVRARDPREAVQARGKQSLNFANADCHYTRTTGIWQTVWLEAVPQTYIKSLRITPQLASSSFAVQAALSANQPGNSIKIIFSDAGTPVAEQTVRADLDLGPTGTVIIADDKVRAWSPEDPHLYDLTVQLLDESGATLDEVTSYAGLRSVSLDGKQIKINGKPVFQRLVLDQGYWPESLMTSPSDEALVRDIELSLAAGFNGARLHQKVFEERFYYHADKLGYLVWGEFADWGAGGYGKIEDHQQPTASFITQWLEVVQRDFNHPSLIGWCPMNETWQPLHDRITQLDDVMRGMFLATKAIDQTRPVLDTSGYSHRVPETDVYDSHDYEQDPAKFAANQAGLANDDPYLNVHDGRTISQPYNGQPYFVSEFGGIWWNPETAAAAKGTDRRESWGYGDRVADEEGFQVRFEGLIGALLDDPNMFGYCYTQLTDVFQEENGIYRFDRSEKLDVGRVRAAQLRPAAYEK